MMLEKISAGGHDFETPEAMIHVNGKKKLRKM